MLFKLNLQFKYMECPLIDPNPNPNPDWVSYFILLKVNTIFDILYSYSTVIGYICILWYFCFFML